MALDPSCIFQQFDRLCHGRQRLILAVSGGSDSMALMRLFADYRQKRPDAPQVLVVTIDHGLRAEAKAEAAFVAAAALSLGFEHRMAAWQGAKPQTGLQAAARAARHQLLRQEALRYGADCVVLGHTLNDQHETYAMRLARSDKGRGLACMAPATLYKSDIWFARPLLHMEREALRDYLRQAHCNWMDDASNHDTRFERVAMRQNLNAIEGRPWQQAANEREALNEAACAYVQARFYLDEGLFIRDDVAAIEGNPVAQLGLAYGLAVMGGRHYLPNGETLRTLLARLCDGPANLSGCLVSLQNGELCIQREARKTLSLLLEPHMSALWDNRFWIKNNADMPVRISGNDPYCPLKDGFNAMCAQGEPLSEGLAVSRHFAIFDHYLPSFDLKLAQIFVSLFDDKAFPESPL